MTSLKLNRSVDPMFAAAVGISFLAFVGFMWIVGPILFLWTIEVLFNVYVDLTPKTWFAAWLFLALVRGGGNSNK